MKEQLITLLKTFNFPVYQQGSLTEDDIYPTAFFTFWNDSTDDGSHYDNDAIAFAWQFTVYFYCTNNELTNSILLECRNLLKQNGWITNGIGYDVPSDEPSHTGRAIDVWYIQNKQEVNNNA